MREKNLATLFQNRVYRFGGRPALIYKRGGAWTELTFEQVAIAVEETGRGLLALGVGSGERVGIFADNRPEWLYLDLAIQSIGAVSVPIYAGSSEGQSEFILRHSGAKIVAVGGEEPEKHLLSIHARTPFRKIIFLDETVHEDDSSLASFASLREQGRSGKATAFYDRLEKVGADDLSTLLYTSGNEGDPKGVVLTHGNILANALGAASVFPIGEEDRSLSFLPLSHAFARTAGVFAPWSLGCAIALTESVSKLPEDLLEVKPTVLLTVPGVLERFYRKVREEIAHRNRLVRWLFKIAIQRRARGLAGALFESLFYRAIRERFGGKLRHLVSGGAALNPRVADFFDTIGIGILEGYGLTEVSPIVSVNLPGNRRKGTVGRPIPSVEIRIAEDREVLVKGPGVMKEYFGDPEATRAMIGSDGYLRTGDIGTLDSHGFLTLIDRKKEILVTSRGKNIPPQVVENQLRSHSLIEQACAIGDGREYLAALIVPNFVLLAELAKRHRIRTGDREALVRDPTIRGWFSSIVERVNSGLARDETVQRFELLTDPFTIENGELTLTLKLRRNVILKRYAAIVGRIYL
ncbi:MAG: long-chain fatty acid--CoA ligase [Pseudomonadota bacterium]